MKGKNKSLKNRPSRKLKTNCFKLAVKARKRFPKTEEIGKFMLLVIVLFFFETGQTSFLSFLTASMFFELRIFRNWKSVNFPILNENSLWILCRGDRIQGVKAHWIYNAGANKHKYKTIGFSAKTKSWCGLKLNCFHENYHQVVSCCFWFSVFFRTLRVQVWQSQTFILCFALLLFQLDWYFSLIIKYSLSLIATLLSSPSLC